MDSICLSIISGGSIKSDTVSCLLDTLHHLPCDVHLFMPIGNYAAQNRTMAVRQAQKIGDTHIMFIDSDMIFPNNGIEKLLAAKKDIIGANYNTRSLPLISTVKIYDDKGEYTKGSAKDFPKHPFKVAAVATGFCLINMDVFKKIPEPWFVAGYVDGEFHTEDIYFCKQANKAGVEVWCDPTLDVLHIGDYRY